MTKIIDYKIIQADTASDLSGLVSRQIEDGWQPFGRPFVHQEEIGGGMFFSQAIVLYGPEML